MYPAALLLVLDIVTAVLHVVDAGLKVALRQRGVLDAAVAVEDRMGDTLLA